LSACAKDKTPAGYRDAAVLAVMFGAGLRRAELAALDVDDLDLDAGTVTVRQGKGRKARVAHLVGGAAARLHTWLAVRGNDAGPLFVPVNQVREIVVRRMTAQSIYNALAKRARLAGIRDVSPHDGRRTFISNLLDAGADIATVQQLAGHANIQTTARYDRRGEVAKARAVALVSLPGAFA
jgi:integrase